MATSEDIVGDQQSQAGLPASRRCAKTATTQLRDNSDNGRSRAACRHHRRRSLADSRRTLLHFPDGGARRPRHQNRAARQRRRCPRIRAFRQGQVHLFQLDQPRQGIDRPRPQGRGRQAHLRGAPRQGRRTRREFPPRHDGEAGLWLGDAPSALFAPHLRLGLGLRPHRPRGARSPPTTWWCKGWAAS